MPEAALGGFGLGFQLIAELLALGVAVGFLAGLLGIGGGMMMVPALSLILTQRGVDAGLAVKMAIASSMATILFTSLASVRAHNMHGTVRWPIARAMSPGIVVGGLIAGAGVFAVLKGPGLALLFVVFVSYSALQMFRNRPPKPGRQLPGAAAQASVGVGIGFLAGLLGTGGAFLAVPFMTRCNISARHAVGTSAAIGVPIAVASTVGYTISGWQLQSGLPGAFGYFYLPAVAIMAVASVSLAPWGARTAQRIPVALLRRLFAVLLMSLALIMLYRTLAG